MLREKCLVTFSTALKRSELLGGGIPFLTNFFWTSSFATPGHAILPAQHLNCSYALDT